MTKLDIIIKQLIDHSLDERKKTPLFYSFLLWPVAFFQVFVIYYDIFDTPIPKRTMLIAHIFVFVGLFVLNLVYMVRIDRAEAFLFLAAGNILDPRYSRLYFKVLLRHWKIIYTSVGFSVAVFYIIDTLYPLHFDTIVAVNGLVIMILQNAPLTIQRQRFFDDIRKNIDIARANTVDTIIESRHIVQERMIARRGIRQIYEAVTISESQVIQNMRHIGNYVELLGQMTTAKLVYFRITRYILTWVLANIIVRYLLITYH